jgi:hypothetical protein
LISWLRYRQELRRAVDADTDDMLKVYGIQATEIASNLARDARNKGNAKLCRHWAKVATRVAERSNLHSLRNPAGRAALNSKHAVLAKEY